MFSWSATQHKYTHAHMAEREGAHANEFVNMYTCFAIIIKMRGGGAVNARTSALIGCAYVALVFVCACVCLDASRS